MCDLFDQSPTRRRGALSLVVASLAVCGCGSQVDSPLLLSAAQTVRCEGHLRYGEPATDRVVIRWSGGVSDLSGGQPFPGLDLTRFELLEGGTLADVSEDFKTAVRSEVAAILCSFPEAAVYVDDDDATAARGATTVFVAQTAALGAPGRIGEGDFDPCNVTSTNQAIVFGDALLELPGPYAFDEWVRAVANVIAHEVGHTLGYNHVARVRSEDLRHSRYVELMFAVHTVPEMIREQRYLAEESNCPLQEDAAAGKRASAPFDPCRVEHR